MPKTIGNPLSWSARTLGMAWHSLTDATAHLASDRAQTPPTINRIGLTDVSHALRLGWQDFAAMRSDVIFLCLLYPLIGLALVNTAHHTGLIPYLFPMASGFALLGPIAGIGLYEISRRREIEGHASWADALTVMQSPSMGAIAGLAVYLLVIFVAWMVTAHVIYTLTLGSISTEGLVPFLALVIGSAEGWSLMAIGIPVGAGFAALVLAFSVVSFPLLLDRDVGVPVAVATSLRVTRKNPAAVLAWGIIVAVLLLLGSLPFFLGLVVVLPVLGHATWHLYRRAVS